MSDEVKIESVRRLALLASAIACRPLEVEPASAGEPTWTDSRVVYVDVHQDASDQVKSLAVQASLLAAGSLDREIVQRLARRPHISSRYLAVEGHRALAMVRHLLPQSVSSLIRSEIAAMSTSPATSLSLALARGTHIELPEHFGAIVPKPLLASWVAMERRHSLRSMESKRVLVELAAEVSSDDEHVGSGAHPNELGQGGAIGKWLSKLLTAVRQLRGGGSPGGDAATHVAGAVPRRSGATFSNLSPGTAEGSSRKERTRGVLYPEWNVHERTYRADWCTVLETQQASSQIGQPGPLPRCTGLRRSLARLGLELERHGRQSQGDDIDIDALVEARIEIAAGAAPDDAFFIGSIRRRRNLSVLILLDVSGSAAEPSTNGQTVHALQRSAAASLMLSLHELGNRVALYAYQSQGRTAVHVIPVKPFGEIPGAGVLERLHRLVPGAYSRLGAAIRHGTTILQTRGGTTRQVLVVLSDGLAYDHGYEPAYGSADARRALAEARNQGVGCLCMSVGALTKTDDLRRVFGVSAHAALSSPEQLQHVIGPLFRAALRSADIRRRLV